MARLFWRLLSNIRFICAAPVFFVGGDDALHQRMADDIAW